MINREELKLERLRRANRHGSNRGVIDFCWYANEAIPGYCSFRDLPGKNHRKRRCCAVVGIKPHLDYCATKGGQRSGKDYDT